MPFAMLVLSRSIGDSIDIEHSSTEGWLLTVEKIGTSVASFSWKSRDPSGEQHSKALKRDQVVNLDSTVQVTLIDIREDKVRIGITAPRESFVHRHELKQAIRRENRAAKRKKRGDGDDPEAALVPKPGPSKPPSLDVRLKEPE